MVGLQTKAVIPDLSLSVLPPGLVRQLSLAALLALQLAAASLPALSVVPAARAQSNLLEAVKRDPARARRLCQQLRELNRQGISYTSKRAVQQIASQDNLSLMDAEVLTTYVVGLHCPDVR
jgi:hypothetical protein